MLDIKRIREDYEGMKAGVERRMKGSFGIEKIPALDEKRRAVLAEVEAMKNKQNTGFQGNSEDEKGRRRYDCNHGGNEGAFRKD